MTLAERTYIHSVFKSPNFFLVCKLIYEKKGITHTEIADQLNFSPSYTSQLLAKLTPFLDKKFSRKFQRPRIELSFTPEFYAFFSKIENLWNQLEGSDKDEREEKS